MPDTVALDGTVSVAGVEPPATVKPFVTAARVSALTVDGVIAPSVNVTAGVVVGLATLPETPLAVTTERLVRVPVPAPFAPGVPEMDIFQFVNVPEPTGVPVEFITSAPVDEL